MNEKPAEYHLRHRTPFTDTWSGPPDYARNCARGESRRRFDYHHFKDKAELIFEVVETRVRETKNLMLNLPLELGKAHS